MIAKIQTRLVLALFLLAVLPIALLLIPAENDWTYYWQDKLFSPGKIYYKHLYNEGKKILCRDCHRPGQALTNDNCSQCHTQNWFLENTPFLAGSHQAFAQQDRCLRCHGEHLGYNTPITLVSLTPEEHKQLPVNPEKCATCHRETGEQIHPTLVNMECMNCHKNFSWSSEFKHIEYLSRANSSQEMLLLCTKCHKPNHHYNENKNFDNRAGCVFCHVMWGKWRKSKEMPFPEELFKDIKVDPKLFKVKISGKYSPQGEKK